MALAERVGTCSDRATKPQAINAYLGQGRVGGRVWVRVRVRVRVVRVRATPAPGRASRVCLPRPRRSYCVNTGSFNFNSIFNVRRPAS
jgi:hypothetical protein